MKNLYFFILSVLYLTFTFYTFQPSKDFYFDRTSESLIIGRIIQSEKSGVFSYGGLTGRNIPFNVVNEKYDYKSEQYDIIQGERKVDDFPIYSTYNSQSGFQGWLYSLINYISPLDYMDNIEICILLICVFSAIVYSLFIIWVRIEYSIFIALFLLAFLGASPWIQTFAHNLWWSLWAFYLPFLSALLINFRRYNLNKDLPIYLQGLIIFFSVFIKCSFNGYEYISTVLMSIYVPYVYYYIIYKTNKNKIFKEVCVVGLSALTGVIIQMLVLITQIAYLKGSFREGINHLIISFNKRTQINDYDSQKLSNDWSSHFSSNEYIQIVIKYLSGNVYNSSIHIYFLYLFLIVFISVAILLFTKNIKYKGLAITTIFSFFVSISWLMLFKQHSVIHTHLNFIVWYIPFLLFGTICSGVVLEILFKKLKKTST
ncbi:hypothetical protein OBK25_01030 [Empedobacter falsenii]